MSHLLEVRSLDKHFGGLHVTRNVSFHVSAGERLALIGPNGAGKTTLVNQVSGVLQPDSGSIFLQGEDVTSRSQAQRVRCPLGIIRCLGLKSCTAQHCLLRRDCKIR